MCGILGLWNLDGRSVDPTAFDRFVDSMAHRGPDGRGVHHDERHRLSLGHRLLAIQSAPAQGIQPMSLAGRYWITFNGEIFNFLELRAELEQRGHSFRTETDSEVVLAAYAEWGEDCVQRFNGMWALAVWDAATEKLFLCVDRLAVKSVVYVSSPQYFAFASEIKAFARLDRFAFEPDHAASVQLLSTTMSSTTKTWVRGVSRLPAGHSLTVDRTGDTTIRRWWTPVIDEESGRLSRQQQTERLRELLFSAVSMRLNGRSSIALPVSGGMDSSAILGVTAELQKQRAVHDVKSFFVRKKGAFDEEPYAAAAAAHCGVPMSVIEHPTHLSVQALQSVVRAYETLTVGSDGPMSVYRAIKAAGASVSLDGHGGDELFGGYEPYLVAAMQDACTGVPNVARLADLVRILRGMEPAADGYGAFEGWSDPAQLAWRLLRDRLRPGPGGRRLGIASHARLADVVSPLPALAGELDKALYIDIHHGFLQRILRTFDYASMAHGVEVRTPFLDWRIVAFALGLKADRKIGRGYTKRILRDAMAGLLPESVLWRRSKVGFVDNAAYFFNPAVKEWMADVVASRSFQENDLWDGRKMVEVHERWRQDTGPGIRSGRQLLNATASHHLITELRRESLAAGARSLEPALATAD